ncbi:MAG TPA: alpha/beta hydrolase [Gammaproteobacteria bacterium]
MRVLMIHGIAQGGKVAADLKKTWVDTLKEGFAAARKPWPANVDFDFPYYGDELDRFVKQAALPTAADVVAKGPGQNGDYERFLQSALSQIEANAAIPEPEIRASLDPMAPQDKGIQNWGWVQAIARTIDGRWTGAVDYTIERYLREVFLYVSRPAVESRINAIVEAMITAEPTIVVGHSLGSVVAYKVIVNNAARLSLKKLITVGSPLGLKAISSKLGRPRNPAGKDGWYNAFDDRDIVALNPLDAEYFPADPSVVNYDRVRNKTDNRHGIIGYLNDREVATKIAAAIAG